MFLKSNSIYPFGLDISDLSLKLVQLDKIREKIKIQAIAKINLHHGIIVNGEIKNKQELIKAVKKIIAEPGFGKVSSEEVVASLPESKTFIELIEIPLSPNPLTEIIGGEIEKHIPMSIDEIYYDWQIIANLPDKHLVLIGAAPKNIVNQYTEMLDNAKLSPIALEIEPISICRSLLAEEKPPASSQPLRGLANKQIALPNIGKNYAILDIGATHTSMIFYSSNAILFTISLPITGEQITDNISHILEINKGQAEKAKIICGLEEDKAQGVIKNILSDIIDNLIKKIKEAIEFYNHHFPENGPINKILLCGGGANIKNLAGTISSALTIETDSADTLINLNETKEKFTKFLREKHIFNGTDAKNKFNLNNLSITQDTGLTYATAIGLALRGIFIDEL